jgi:hypothetical protein
MQASALPHLVKPRRLKTHEEDVFLVSNGRVSLRLCPPSHPGPIVNGTCGDPA